MEFRASKPHHRGAAITVGSFDGIHLGHGALIARTCALAAHAGRPAIMLTFEPLPREYLMARATPPQDPPARLTDLRERWRVLVAFGPRGRVRAALQREAAAAHRASSSSNLLAERFAASAVVVGQDFRFGRGGAGSVALLQAAADAGRFALELVPSVCVDDVRVSSSGVRTALASGDFRAARDLLGRAYSMRGRVVAGEKLGRRLGFPTANIRMRRHKLPFTGVYAVRVRGIDGNLARDAVASLGFRPTVDGVEPLLEVHVFDFSGWLYNRELEVEFVAKIRDEEKFDEPRHAGAAHAPRCGEGARAAGT